MIKLVQYTSKDSIIQASLLVPFVIVLNYLLFGSRYIFEGRVFLLGTLATFIIMAASWQCHTWVAVVLRQRFSRDRETIKRLFIAIILFIIMTGITISILFLGYDYIRFLNYELDEPRYNQALAIGALINIFVTIVHESVHSFEKWKQTLIETEQLKKEYMQSQLLGLRNQVSPHFLFNSLNSLSSLISDQPVEAGAFLDEMSKVYRYLLRNNEEQTVEMETELQFVRSYYHLLKTRYGSAVELTVNVSESDRKKLLPPLTLQILLDNILKINLISKLKPLKIDIYVNDEGWLEIKNNVQKRISEETIPEETGIANISNKFRLLCQHSLQIIENGIYRIIKVPLISTRQTQQA